jgi:uncharacterized protein YdaU (DUF1376 family)
MSRKPDQWMPLYIADYLADTQHLSAEQHGAYLLLLMAAWKRGGALPDDDDQLAAIARLDAPRWRKSSGILRGFFKAQDGQLVQGRLAVEYADAVRVHEAQKANGGKGGRPRKETQQKPMGFDSLNPRGNPKPNPDETPSPSPRAITPEGSPTPEKSLSPDTASPCVGTPAGHAAAALMRAGLRITSQNPNLIAACSEGVTAQHLLDLHRAYPDKPATYLVAAARRLIAEAPGAVNANRTPSRKLSAVERIEANIRAGQAADAAAAAADRSEPFIEGQAKRLTG